MKEAIKFWACQCSKHTLALGQQIGVSTGITQCLGVYQLVEPQESLELPYRLLVDSNELPIALGSGSKWGLKLTQSY